MQESKIEDGEPYFKQLFDQCSSLMQLVVNCPKPVIAQISGIATAADVSWLQLVILLMLQAQLNLQHQESTWAFLFYSHGSSNQSS
jgi:hypothetical protein